MFTTESLAKSNLRIKKDLTKSINLSSNEAFFSKKLETLLDDFLSNVSKNKLKLGKYLSLEEIRENFSNHIKIKKNELIFSPGSDSGIFYLFSFFRTNFNKILLIEPDYFNYKHYAKLLNFETLFTDKKNINILAKNEKNLLICLSNPNGVIGSHIEKEKINALKNIAKQNNHHILFDLAYEDFYEQNLLSPDNNTSYIKTLSKSYAAAGIRTAFIATSKENAISIRKLGIENGLGVIQQLFFQFIIKHKDIYKEIIKETNTNKENFINNIKHLNKYKVFPSSTNFVSIKLHLSSAHQYIIESLEKENILIKDLSNIENYNNTIRVTIGEKEVMEKVTSLLQIAHSIFT